MQGPFGLFDILVLILIRGLPMTLALTLLSLLVGFLVGLLLALVRVYAPYGLNYIAIGYEKIFRGIPLLVLIFIFGAALLRYFIWTGSLANALFFAAMLSLALRSAAYQSEIFRGAIMSVDAGQMMAAKSIGMNTFQATRNIILPQALRLSLPGWANEYAVVIKDTSLASAIGISDLIYQAQAFTWDYPAQFLPIILIVAIIYFVFTYPVTRYLGESMTLKLRQLGLGGGR